MTEALEGAIAGIAAVVAGVSGLEQVLTNPTETANTSLFAVVYAAEGRFDVAPIGTKRALHSITIDVLKRRTDLAKDVAALKPYIDTVAAALLGEVSAGGGQFGGTVVTFGGITYRLTIEDWAGVKMIGYRFTMTDTKLLTNL